VDIDANTTQKEYWNKEIGTFFEKTFWMEHGLPRCKCSKTTNIIRTKS
jgi:hypothetical protein